MPDFCVLYRPTVADIDEVSGRQAYFLLEAGYQTSHDVVQASPEEMAEVYQVSEDGDLSKRKVVKQFDTCRATINQHLEGNRRELYKLDRESEE